MMGIPVLGPVYISGDNQSVLANSTVPESQLKKKSQSIAYHFVRRVLLMMNGVLLMSILIKTKLTF